MVVKYVYLVLFCFFRIIVIFEKLKEEVVEIICKVEEMDVVMVEVEVVFD